MIFPRASPGGFFPLHRTELPARPAPPPATSGTAFPAAHCANVTFQQSHSYGRKPWGLGCCQERSRLGAGRQPVNQSRLTAKHTSWATDFCSRSLALSLASPCLHRSCSAAFCQPFCLPLLFLLLGCPAGFAPCCAWGQLPAWGSCCAMGAKGVFGGAAPCGHSTHRTPCRQHLQPHLSTVPITIWQRCAHGAGLPDGNPLCLWGVGPWGVGLFQNPQPSPGPGDTQPCAAGNFGEVSCLPPVHHHNQTGAFL